MGGTDLFATVKYVRASEGVCVCVTVWVCV